MAEPCSLGQREIPWPAESVPDKLCTVAPVTAADLQADDIIRCKVNGSQFLHLMIKAIQRYRFQIGNNRGYINGRIGEKEIFGKGIRVE